MDALKPVRDISIIVPVLDDLEALHALARQIAQQRSRPRELIVVCGKANEQIRLLCRTQGYVYLETQPQRGAQRDHGAEVAQASILWFVHADAELDPSALDAIAASVARGAESGCFRFEFQGPPSAIKRLTERLVALRIRVGGMAYGDQALFATRAAYFESGGFTHEPLFDEVRLVKRLRRRGTFVALGTPVFVATRRWERDGWIKRSLHNRWLALCHAAGIPAKALNSAYRKPKRKEAGS